MRLSVPLVLLSTFAVGCTAPAPRGPYGESVLAHTASRTPAPGGGPLGLASAWGPWQDEAADFEGVVDPDSAPSQGHEASDSERMLPFFGDAARERGYELPKPLGAGANFVFINRPTTISGVQAGVNGTGLNDVEFLDFEAEASVRTAMARFDAWIFPMLNVYLLGGYIWNNSEVRTTVDVPGAPNTTIVSQGDLEGPVYGGGATLAGGYKEFFATVDANWTKSELGELSEFLAALYSFRIGWNTKLGDSPLRVYTGAVYWDTKRTIEGSIPLSGPIVNSVEFAVDQEPVDPWTIILGTTVTVNDQLWIMLEVGAFDETQSITTGIQWRF